MFWIRNKKKVAPKLSLSTSPGLSSAGEMQKNHQAKPNFWFKISVVSALYLLWIKHVCIYIYKYFKYISINKLFLFLFSLSWWLFLGCWECSATGPIYEKSVTESLSFTSRPPEQNISVFAISKAVCVCYRSKFEYLEYSSPAIFRKDFVAHL